ncbi:hypothetical protein AKG11_03460 [Shinella sp. SUS2]|uniref:hypothetical protein n=1 Tax=unclassified Shinella TaxID=2643062 RepID=UPI0006815486|nr:MULTISPECIES: hypothetical protein [unclassified Shinella]KNY18211.1 hypothetical protein AKG11_03460 [Shinella sp. SUS2]KOC77406.1 hypothetical protein AKG10_00930 [Shinella sp. GWS1]
MPEKHRILTDHQADIARALSAVLQGCEYADAFPAMVSIMACSINDGAPTREEALEVAGLIGEQIFALVEAGRAGLLEAAR